MTIDDVAARVQRRVRTVLMSLSVICAILPTAIILFAIDAQNKSATLAHDTTIVDGSAAEIGSNLHAVEQQLESAGSFLTENPGDARIVDSLVKAIRSSNQYLLRVTYFDENGAIVGTSSVPSAPSFPLYPVPSPVFHRWDGLPYVTLSTNRLDGDVLSAALSLRGEQKRIENLAEGTSGRVYLIDESGRPLMSSGARPSTNLVRTVAAGKRIMAAPGGSEGRICFVTTAAVRGTNWRLVLSHPAPRFVSLNLPLLLAVGAALFAVLMALASILILRRTSLEPAIRRIEYLSSTSRSLENTVRQTEMLLRETHHRVKNDLQILSSMLGLSDRPGLDSSDHKVLVDSRNRVHAISLIHELLYKSNDLNGVSIKGYIAELVHRIEGSLLNRGNGVTIVSRVGDYYFDTDTCVACGLLLNELLTNSLKHAFPSGDSGVILIRIDRIEHDRFLLEVQDDGIGISVERTAPAGDSLGLRLIQALTEQLSGTLSVESDGGTAWRIQFVAREVVVRA
ncbi:MAG TPA: sensor histidine kinase [Spirochaetia bacterium]|nr:sensor histidine kinase [Spirochaetia bacterium]